MSKEGTLSSIRSMFDSPSVRAIENVLDIASSRWFDPSEPPAPQPADIFPGKYNKCKYTPLELAYTLALTPGTKADLEYLFNLGKADGAAWAAEVGLSNPAACQNGAGAGAAGAAAVAGESAAAVSVTDSNMIAQEAGAAPALPSADNADRAAAAAESGMVGSADAADIVVGGAPAAAVAAEVAQQHQANASGVAGSIDNAAAVADVADKPDGPLAAAASSSGDAADAAAVVVAETADADAREGANEVSSDGVVVEPDSAGPASKRLPFWKRG
jgi:hypothetical protein